MIWEASAEAVICKAIINVYIEAETKYFSSISQTFHFLVAPVPLNNQLLLSKTASSLRWQYKLA
jgi:hypothetical protein